MIYLHSLDNTFNMMQFHNDYPQFFEIHIQMFQICIQRQQQH